MKKKILIIDDDLDMCALLSRFLNKKGFEPEVAHNAAKGLQDLVKNFLTLFFAISGWETRMAKTFCLKLKRLSRKPSLLSLRVILILKLPLM